MDITTLALLILIVLFIILLVIGVPIAVALAMASLLPMLLYVPWNIVLMASSQNLLAGMNKYSLIGITLFILSGAILNETGLARRLVNLAKLLGGWIPGSIAHINVIANALFGALSGSAVAAASAIGKVMIPIAEEEGYNKEFAAAVNIASSPIGFLIPPSGMFIIYSTLTGGAASITALFVAGYFPGIMMALGIMIVSYFVAKKNNYGTTKVGSWKESLTILIDGLPALSLMAIVIGGIILGIFTATEAAGIAAFYSFILAIFYKSLSWEKFWNIMNDTVIISSTVLFLVAASSIMSWLFSFSRIPIMISDVLLNLSDNKYVILMIINLILFIMGMFMDISPINVIFTPIFFPIVQQLGVDPVHFGVIMVANSAIGVCTPPVGNVLFVGSGIANVKVEKVIPWVMPMIMAQIIIVTIITFWEDGVLFLPRFLGLM